MNWYHVHLPRGAVVLEFSVDGGLPLPGDLTNFEVHVSTNLLNWLALTNQLHLTNGFLQIQDNHTTNHPVRFYRVLER